jgi:hypothetical protein
MACDINTGRGRKCRNKLGGNGKLYIFNYVEDPFTYAAGVATAINVALTTVFEFDLVGDNNTLVQDLVPNRSGGTSVCTQTLNIDLYEIDAATSAQLSLLTYGFAQAVVKDRNGLYHALGVLDGMDWTVNEQTGGAKADMYGYKLTATAETKELAPKLDGATTTAFLALV